jgi:hypothetical protein
LLVGVAVQDGDGVLVAARRGAGGEAAEARGQMAAVGGVNNSVHLLVPPLGRDAAYRGAVSGGGLGGEGVPS